MVDVTGSARRLFARLRGTRAKPGTVDPGVSGAVDGNTAVAILESWASEAASLGASFPALGAVRRFKNEEGREGVNALGRPLSVFEATGPRGSLASAMGLTLSGTRSATFLSGSDLLEAGDLLSHAAGRRLPLVVYLAGRAPAGQGVPGGSGHEAFHAAARSGAVVLVAATVQEAADYALIGRKLAEDALTPVVVAMDGEETALSVQDLELATQDFVRQFLGDPRGTIHPPVPSQEMLFGKHRRRVPRWHDRERPFLTGPVEDQTAYALGEAGRFSYLDWHIPEQLQNAFASFAQATGRSHEWVTTYQVEDAQLVLVAMGSAVETLEAVANRLRKTKKRKIGVIGIRALRPFPAAQIVELLQGKKTVAVMERTAGEAVLAAEIRLVLGRALDNARHGLGTYPGIPKIEPEKLPRLAMVFYGMGGFPIRATDVDALSTGLEQEFRSPVFLGIEFSPETSAYPKRQVLLDTLRRNYPGSERLGVRGTEEIPPTPTEVLHVAVHRLVGRGGDRFVGEGAALLQRVAGGHVRARFGHTWEHWDRVCVDRLLHGAAPVKDPGDDSPADIVVWAADRVTPRADLTARLQDGGIVLVERGEGSFWDGFPVALRRDIKTRNHKLYAVKGGPVGDHREERLLGAFLGLLVREGKLEVKPRKLLGIRDEMLEDLPQPERERRVGELSAGFELVQPVETSALELPSPVEEREPKTPEVVRRLSRTDDEVDSLSRFWDQVGILYHRGQTEELAPDPHLAAGIIPPLSSAFRDLAYARDMIPNFEPAKCTGCGDCWSACPDEAMSPVVLGTQALIEAGMTLARERGGSADALRPLLSKLSGRVNVALAKDPEAGITLGEAMTPAFEAVLEKASMPEERKAGVREAYAGVEHELGSLPVSRTAPFFDEPEREQKGSGELLGLAINSEACKGCGVCVAVCETKALVRTPQDAKELARARRIWNLVEKLPATPEATLQRAREHTEVGPVSSALLSREARVAFVGGDGAEPGSGEKIAVRQILATAHSHFEPRLKKLVQDVVELRDRLGETIRTEMAKALPTGDLEALSAGLGALDRPEVDLGELAGRVETAFDSGRIEVSRLQRLVDVAREVNTLHWRLTHGEGGLGRAAYSLVVGPGSAASWMGAFPNNPFGVPVTVDASGETVALARGVLEGLLRKGTGDFAVLRRAQMELDDPKEAERSGEELAGLAWRGLTPEERELIPPLFVVISEDSLGGETLGSLFRRETEDLPLKVIVLSDVGFDLGWSKGPLTPDQVRGGWPADLELVALGLGGALVAQSSIAHPRHLDKTMERALASRGPALIRIHAPSPVRHGFERDLSVERARDAVATRAFPLFRIDPDLGGVDISGNPKPETLWAQDAEGMPLTPAHWARKETRFAGAFTPIDGTDVETIALVEYLALPAEERLEKVPVVVDEVGLRYRVEPMMVRAVEGRKAAWETLQALALPGEEASPVVAASEVEQILAQHRAEVAALKQDYETRLAAQGHQLKLDMAHKVRGRLLTLLARRTGGNGKEETTE